MKLVHQWHVSSVQEDCPGLHVFSSYLQVTI